jgi:hypothetical protein
MYICTYALKLEKNYNIDDDDDDDDDARNEWYLFR